MAKDITGLRFGKLVVIRLSKIGKPASHNNEWECRCDCGTIKIIKQRRLLYGRSAKSCGCLMVENQIAKTHGDTGTVEHRAWLAMFFRCYNMKHRDQRWYASKGIGVCRRWRKYENFLADMGRRPAEKTSLDRINSLKSYSPSNCRWATWDEQKASGLRGRFSKKFVPNATAKLTPDDVRFIKSRLAIESNKGLARKFGVHPSTISNIRTGNHWRSTC